MIELVFDFVSVNALLALNPAKQLADEMEVELKLTPLRTTSELGVLEANSEEDSVGERHRRVRAAYTRQDALRYAAVQGLEVTIDGADCDSTIALKGQLIANARGKGFEYASETFTKYWRGDLLLNSLAQVSQVLESCNIDQFDLTDSRWNLDAIKEELNSREIFMVPMFLVDGERYMGRQHLPMIRWQLMNYEGEGPL